MQTTDKQFFITFLGVTGILVILAVLVLIAANVLGANSHTGPIRSAAQAKMVAERIAPIGKVNLASAAGNVVAVATTGTGGQAGAVENLGKQVYSGICQSCHATGAASAPIVGDLAAWQERIAQGIEVLYNSGINGKGIMAAKGGNPALSDEEVKAAVDYMVKFSQ